MAVEAVKKAMADAGLKASDVDGMMSYQSGDSTPANWVAPDLGIRLNFWLFGKICGSERHLQASVLSGGSCQAGSQPLENRVPHRSRSFDG